ncbi:cystathionine gamma-synthase family protein [Cytophagaceae bacterium DM2B3-1]|uniref:Cystathionine gamma-synthase family protein n=1 Tax=Xanthocytophaga flava TaxID=3048013 RepID=A0ABT7CXH9_9BACT|nr:cystathionine gamma-synthase family protein [Xanthocytophaga flavus]MDJ1473562.1 cystathionine gamma-synthase family protein [Xanthocytophaga flavus]MDJ1498428.1 cystathionine gamma-synthase family protein [Xanthocytophaga flavus]
MNSQKGFTTRTLHSDRLAKPEFGALHQPVHNAVTWGYEQVEDLVNVFQNKAKGYAYSRQGNPTVSALEHKITQMEQGLATVAFATGMAAVSATLLALLKAGDHIIASSYLFGNTRSLMQTLMGMGLQINFVDATDGEQIKDAYQPNTRMVFVETIANPATQIADLAVIGMFCQEKGIVYVVDNTMASPYLFSPKAVQASLIIHSLTKYIGGHGNALGGSVTDTGLYHWERFPNIAPILREQIKPDLVGITQIRKRGLRDSGGTLSPEAAHHLSVGSETLALRMERACSNAMALAEYLQSQPLIAKVYYPGLSNHPQHTLATQLFKHPGALMSFALQDQVDCLAFLNQLQLVIKSSNLGDTRTLSIPVAQTIFYELGAERRVEMQIPESMIRLSVGIEDIEDLISDFEQAFGKMV